MIRLLATLHISFEEIEKATNNFADENLLKQGEFFKVYKGTLFQSRDLINIVARICLDRSLVHNELAISENLKHERIVSAFRFTIWKNEDIIINKYEAKGSLDKHLSDQTLTWMQRLHICVGVAHALKYLHHDAEDDHNIIHGNIKSSKILLDDKWEPKLHGFAFAGRSIKDQLHRTNKTSKSLQYMDPTYESIGGLTYKSDVFSFGVLLYEVLLGREASIENNDNWYFARWVRSHYEEKKIDDLIYPYIRNQMSLHSLNIFCETAYCCLKEQRSERPDMSQVLSRLEEALKLQQKYEHLNAAMEGSSSNHLKGGSFDHLRIRLSEILSATNNFSDTFYIGYGGYGRVYKAELHHFDGINPLVVEGKNTGEIHKRHTTVAIKRIITRVDTQAEQGFFTEIELLSKCRHSNVVSLLGFCDERSEMILVYEYVSNGSLENFLENKDRRINFTWAERIQMCLDIANGLNYLHTSTEDKQCIIHRDIKSANILLNDKWEAKIADFGLSKLHYAREKYSTLATNNIAGTQVYLDPEYEKTGRLKTKSDIYSFGVVMFEIMCGTLAYDKTYDEKGLPSLARQCFVERTLKNLVDPNIEKVDMLFGGFDQESFDMFTNVAYKCIAIAQSERPTMEFVIRELQKALNIQKNKGLLHISLNAMNMGTQNFSDSSCLGEGRFWKLYKGEVEHANGYSAITAKRWDSHSRKGDDQFWKELAILFKHKHENIIHLIGFCYEKNEKIIVYEHASNGRLDKHFDDVNLRWMKRLEICFDVANGLKFLHTGGAEKDDKIIHGDIKSGSILLDDDWNAKICNLECSCKTMVYDRAEHIDDSAYDSLGHVDPKYKSTGYLTEKSDIYSLGVILLEMLCGKLAWEEGCEDHSQSLVPLAKKHYETNRNLNEMIFTGIKEQIEPLSLTTFVRIVFQCIEDEWDERPEASEVVIQLKEALGFQKNSKKNFHISLEAIQMGTQNFSDRNCIEVRRYQKLYAGQVAHAYGFTPCVVKVNNRSFFKHEKEVEFLLNYKHENIIALLGYCNEDQGIIVYENVSKGRLSKYLMDMDPSITWMKRLKISIGVAKGCAFLHTSGVIEDIGLTIDSILLDGDWNAKICPYSQSLLDEHPYDDAYNKLEYFRLYLSKRQGIIYSLGVILLKMLGGRPRHRWDSYPNVNIDTKMLFPGTKEPIAPQSVITFQNIAMRCLHDETEASEVVIQLEKALEFQLLYDETYCEQSRSVNLDETYCEQPRSVNLDETYCEQPRGGFGKLRLKGETLENQLTKKRRNEGKKIEDYLRTLESNYLIIVNKKEHSESSLKEALSLYPENENLNEWREKMEELFGKKVEGEESRCENQSNEERDGEGRIKETQS